VIASEREQLEEGLRLQKAGLLEEALQLYDAASRSGDGTIRALALCRKADLYRVWSRWEQAADSAREGAAVARKAGEYSLYAEAINAEANVYHQRGEFDAALPLYERVLELPVDDRIRGLALQNMGSIAAQREDLDAAERLFLDSYWHFRRAGYDWGVAFVLNNQAAAALDRGRRGGVGGVVSRIAVVAARRQEQCPRRHDRQQPEHCVSCAHLRSPSPMICRLRSGRRAPLTHGASLRLRCSET